MDIETGLEYIKYSPVYSSIKDLDGDVTLKDNKWNCLFDFVLNKTDYFYLWGYRLNFREGMDSLKSTLTESDIYSDTSFARILIRVKPNQMKTNRGALSSFWVHYEQVALLFFDHLPNEEFLKENFIRLTPYETVFANLSPLYMFHKSFEINVIWVRKHLNMPFPEIG